MKRTKLLLAVIAGGSVLFHAARAAQPFETWTARNPLPTGNNLYAVAYGVNISGSTNFIAVGQSGTIMTASTGSNWVTRVSGTNCDLFGVALGNNSLGNLQVIAVGRVAGTGQGRMLASSDGFNWSSANPGTTNGLFAVAYGANGAGSSLFVAVGKGGTIIASNDGTNWTARSSGTTNTLFGIAFGNVGGVSTWVAVGEHINNDGTSSGTFIRSTDGGATWTASVLFPPPGAFTAVIYTTGGFVVVGPGGGIYTAADGLTWKQQTSGTGFQLNGVAFGGGKVITVGQVGTVLTSPDAKTWSTNDSGVTLTLWAVAYGNNTYVAVGDNGMTLASPNGSAWGIGRFRVVAVPLLGIASGTSNLVAVSGVTGSSGDVVTSTNGTYWIHLASVTNTALRGVTYGTNSQGNPLFVAVGNAVVSNAPNILVSPDSANWATSNLGGGSSLAAVACGRDQSGPLFVAVGSPGAVFISADGTNWSSHPTGQATPLNAVAYGSGRFVAVGQGGATAASTNGVNWVTNNAAALGDTLNGIAFGHGIFVAVGAAGTGVGPVYLSVDGLNWVRNSSLSPLTTLFGVAHGDGTFVAVGPPDSANSETAAVFTSSDGTNWIWRNCGAGANLNAVTYSASPASQFVTVGDSDLIVGATFHVPAPVSFSSATGARVSLMDLPLGRIINVQSSHDLATWSLVTNMFLTRNSPSSVVLDSTATNFSKTFYSIGLK